MIKISFTHIGLIQTILIKTDPAYKCANKFDINLDKQATGSNNNLKKLKLT